MTTANTHTFEQRGTPEAASARRLALTIRQLSPWVHHEWEKKDAELKQQAKLEEEANRPFPKPRKSSSAKGQPKGRPIVRPWRRPMGLFSSTPVDRNWQYKCGFSMIHQFSVF